MSCDCQCALTAASTVKVSSCADLPYLRPTHLNWCCCQRLLRLKTRSMLGEYPLAPQSSMAYYFGSMIADVERIASVTYNFAVVASCSSLTRSRLLSFGLRVSHQPKLQRSQLRRPHSQNRPPTHYESIIDSIGIAVAAGGLTLISVGMRYWVAS